MEKEPKRRRLRENRVLVPEDLGIRENREPLAITGVEVITRNLELVAPFETSFGRFEKMTKTYPIITFQTQDGEKIQGIGECTPLPAPWYDGETEETVAVALSHILPAIQRSDTPITDSDSFINRYKWVVGHNMAKAGVEGAYWDAVARMQGVPVSDLWGGTRKQVEAGTSVGLEATPELMMGKIDRAVDMGVARVKIKIKPGKDLEFVEAIRRKYPDLRLQVDANAAYDLFNPAHIAMLRELDGYGLMMIEQPGPNDDILDHATQLASVATPICLDESIVTARQARQALQLWQQYSDLSRLIINIKPPRVGGFREAIRIARLCAANGVSTWCGGMLESAVGKTANVHFSSIPEVDLPGDHVSQGPYYKEDVAETPEYANGAIIVPTGTGWGLRNVTI